LALRLSIVLSCALAAAVAQAAPRVIAVDVDGIIHPVTFENLDARIRPGARQNAEVVLIRLNTPGGLMEAMRDRYRKSSPRPFPLSPM